MIMRNRPSTIEQLLSCYQRLSSLCFHARNHLRYHPQDSFLHRLHQRELYQLVQEIDELCAELRAP